METSTDRINRRAEIEAMPRWRFVCERDWAFRDLPLSIGFVWGRNLDAPPGEYIYRGRWLLYLRFKIWIER